MVTVVRPDFAACQVVPGGSAVTATVCTVKVAGMAIRTQPRSCCPSAPPRFQNVALIVVSWRALIVDGVSEIAHVDAAARLATGAATAIRPRASAARIPA